MTAEGQLRRTIYALLIAASVGGVAARIGAVTNGSRTDPSPFLSANDRSRWCTIRALVEDGTYAIDQVIFKPTGERDRAWHTIDLVRHKGPDGREHYYSSKPTLLPTLLAGQYWVLRQVTGARLSDRGKLFYVVRLMLLLTSALPWGLALCGVAWLAERYGTTSAGRVLMVAAAAQGTFLTTFGATLNNHVLAAECVIFALVAAAPLWDGGSRAWPRFVLAGLFAAGAAANELPALAFLALLGGVLLWRAPVQALLGFAPPVLLVGAAALGTNYLAHGSWQTPYAHRNRDGATAAVLEISHAAELSAGRLPPAARQRLAEQKLPLSAAVQITERTPGARWVLWDPERHERYALQRVERAGGAQIEVRQWDDWYDYEGTYWLPERLQGVDKGEQSRLVYAFHLLAGHHGIFSLTPLWLLSLAGATLWLRGGAENAGQPSASASAACERRSLALATLGLTLVVLGFYLSRPLIDRNYGGVTCGLRWLFWLIPLWLIVLLPAADRLLRSRWGVAVAGLVLAVSVFSAQYAADNPWSHPWLFDYWTHLGWIRYE